MLRFRYDHYAVLCELLPTGLISLAVCLKTWLNGKYDDQVYNQISSSLGYTQQTPLILCPVNRYIDLDDGYWNEFFSDKCIFQFCFQTCSYSQTFKFSRISNLHWSRVVC